MPEQPYDIVIIGASFAGLTLAHHLPKNLSVLIVDSKPTLDHAVESTGLITQATYDMFATFMDIKKFIPNQITHIGVVAPDYVRHFFSRTKEPWIYSTDTPNLVKHLAETVPANVQIRIGTFFAGSEEIADGPYKLRVRCQVGETEDWVLCRFLVGADGAYSSVARDRGLQQNWRFLSGFEKVFYGDILLGDAPEASVYHFWFGEFSLGYGGWLSPTIINGKKAFRLGLAKLKQDVREWTLIREFVATLQARGIIRIEPETKEVVQFSSLIPMNGVLRRISDDRTLLIGDAAGTCGAFAADGIKGSIACGKIAAELIPAHLNGQRDALGSFHRELERRYKLMTYYRKQLLYRMVWDMMQRDRTFTTLWRIIDRQREHFLKQFCDSKDRQKSLVSVVLTWRNLPLLCLFSLQLAYDIPLAFIRSGRRHGWVYTTKETARWLALPFTGA